MKKHYSVIDWDRNVPALMTLSDTRYISAPYSLYAHKPDLPKQFAIILSRHTQAQNIPDGRLVFHTYFTFVTGPDVATFRNQSPLGQALINNCFDILLWPSSWSVRLYENGEITWYDSTPSTFLKDQWHHLRLSWWEGFTMLGVPALCIALEKKIGAEWVKQGDTLYDPDSHYKESSINRCGHIAFIGGTDDSYFDDTEIWKRTD